MFAGSQRNSKNVQRSCTTKSNREAFTLLEVMVAVMIISVVVAALLQMMGNSSHLFSKVKIESNVGQYASFLIASPDYGFENKSITLDKLAEDFKLDSQLRTELKKLKAKLVYTELESIDMSEFDTPKAEDTIDNEEDQTVSSELIFEIGKSTLEFKDASTSLLRLRVK